MTFDPEILKRLPVELRTEISENLFRKDWTPSELNSARRRIEPYIAEKAREHQREGGRQKGGGKLPPAERFKTGDVVAELLGTSRRHLEKIADVVAAAEADPEKWGKFMQEMDADGSPHGVYKRLRAAQLAERIDDDNTPEIGDPVVRPGEVWLLDDHKLMCGDSTLAENVERLLAGAVPHLMVTDPPYGLNFDAGWRSRVFSRPRKPRSVMNDDRTDWRAAFELFLGDVAYVYRPNLYPEISIAALEAVGFERRANIVAKKSHFVINGGHYHSQYEGCWYAVRPGRNTHWTERRDQPDVWDIERSKDGRDDRTDHGTQKPIGCMFRPIENSSQPDDAVYDPFVGSGTTIIAAEIAGRRCYAMDLNPVSCTGAVERWQTYTKRNAHLEVTGQTFDQVRSERTA